MNVNNGRLVDIELPGFSGQAGFVEREDHDEVSFVGSLKSVRVAPGDVINIDGGQRIVGAVSASPFMRGFVVLELVK